MLPREQEKMARRIFAQDQNRCRGSISIAVRSMGNTLVEGWGQGIHEECPNSCNPMVFNGVRVVAVWQAGR